MVLDGVGVAPGGSCALLARAGGGECGGEGVEGRRECRAYMSNGEGSKLHRSPVFLEGRDERDVLVGLGFEFVFTSQVPTKSDLDDNVSAKFLVEGGRVREGGVGYPLGVNKLRRCAVTIGIYRLDFVGGEDPLRDTAGGCRAFRIALGGGEAP
jgi:hypothetical protein